MPPDKAKPGLVVHTGGWPMDNATYGGGAHTTYDGAGANAIGVISDETKRDYVMSLGAKGVINRNNFKCWGQLPKVNGEGFPEYMKEVGKFGKAVRAITGGKVMFDGQDTTRLAPHLLARRGLYHVREGRQLFTDMTVLENLEMGAFSPRARAS